MDTPVEEARALLATLVSPIEEVERVPIDAALGRVLARDLVAPFDVPSADNSAMDGYAFAAASRPPLRVIGAAHAGHAFGGAVGPGECVRIMTGAVVPAGADTVVMQEETTRDGDAVRFEGAPRPGQNVRRAGEDLARGATVLRAGRVLRPADLGVAASLGEQALDVRRRARVGVFTTGDELRAAGGVLAPGQLFDSNGPTLRALIAAEGHAAVDLGHVPDDAARIRELVTRAARELDAIVSTGGVAVGDADHVRPALADFGVRSLRVAMRPGRHLAVGAAGRCAFFGLPGNPVAALTAFIQLVAPALRKLSGATPRERLRLRARSVAAFRNDRPRLELQRGVLERAPDGALVVRSTGPQGSGILRSVVEASCFVVLPPACGELPAGSLVDVEPLD